jgi:hypothetical protein
MPTAALAVSHLCLLFLHTVSDGQGRFVPNAFDNDNQHFYRRLFTWTFGQGILHILILYGIFISHRVWERHM